MRIIVFGVGQSYKRYKEIFSNDEIVGFMDNNSDLWNHDIDGVKIYSPERINQLEWDSLVVMSIHYKEILAQLQDLGIPRERIKTTNEYVSSLSSNTCRIYDKNPVQLDKLFCGVAIVVHILNSNGATMAALNLARVMQMLGYHVTLIAPAATGEYIDFCVDCNMTVIIDPTMKYRDASQFSWLDKYPLVILNSIAVMNMVPRRWNTRVIWWLHDPLSGYKKLSEKLIKAADDTRMETYAVSQVAKASFQQYFLSTRAHLLPFGIPDYASKNNDKENLLSADRLCMIIAGKICSPKGQEVLIDALGKLSADEIEKLETYIVGDDTDVSYAAHVKQKASALTNVNFTGVLSRKKLEILHRDKISITLCASEYETMSVAVMEGLMNGELCIITSVIGIAAYLTDGKDCLMYEYGDSEALAKIIRWTLTHKKEVARIQHEARRTYEKFFTMEAFAERVKRVMEQ